MCGWRVGSCFREDPTRTRVHTAHQHQLMHSILDEPAERLRHLLRLHKDALKSEKEVPTSVPSHCFGSCRTRGRGRFLLLCRPDCAFRFPFQLRVAESGLLLESNWYLKKLRRMEQILALHAQAVGPDVSLTDPETAQLAAQAAAILTAPSSRFALTHTALPRTTPTQAGVAV